MTSQLLVKLPPAKPVASKKSWKAWLAMPLLATIGGVIGYFAARYGSELLLPTDGRKWLKLITLATVPLVWLFVVGWHEAGHLLGGRLAGGKFLLYVVGPLKWQRTPSGVRFCWNRSINLAGGLAACLPLDGRDLPRRLGLMIVGGPVASVVLVVLALWVAVGFGQLGWVVPQHVASLTALVSAVIFFVTAVPGEAGGFKTDGRRLIELVRGGPKSEQEAALMALTVAGLAGVRPADYEPEKVAASVAPDDGSLNTTYGHLNAYLHHADLGDWAAAQSHLDRVIAGEHSIPPFVGAMARAEYAWLLAQAGGDPAAARAWLATAGKVEFDPATVLRAEAAVLLAEGRRDEAAVKAREGLVALETKSLAPVKSAFAAEALERVLLAATSGAVQQAGDPT